MANNNNELAIVKPETIDEYVPVNVGEPTTRNHATTRMFVEDSIEVAEANLKHDIAKWLN